MKGLERKKRIVEDLANLMNKNQVVGIIDLTNLPSSTLQKIRSKLRDDAKIITVKKILIQKAIEKAKEGKKGLEKLEEFLGGIPALILTNKDSFRLSKLLLQHKSSAVAKPGQIAPNDIVIPAGPTEFTPGPVIGELGQIGLKTAVENGKIAIKEDKLIVKKGDIINQKISAVIAKLGIEPMTITMNLVGTFENGLIYKHDVLSITEEEYMNNLKLAALQAYTLALKIEYPAEKVIKQIVTNAALEEKALAAKLNLSFEETKEEPKIEVKHEPKIEIKKEEPKVEIKQEPIIQEKSVKVKEVKPEIIEKEVQKAPLTTHDRFDESVDKAQEVLKKLQDQKMKKGKT
ncbi:MAG: 50S ribosomal protein L10 [Candidatus Nanoarchaeia archaeon]|nr:50S ribosomal protein L10 [Candidatus Nanoarchaeia archaeon]MDD5587970.1 50S ribosomal protein L10 [Candidatus Nanoarchaeia archaeon]